MRVDTALRRLLACAMLTTGLTGTMSGVGLASSLPQQDLTATGAAALPNYQTYTASSTGTSPAHVTVTLTQTSALGFAIKSTFTDDTAGAVASSNQAYTMHTGTTSNETQIPWSLEDGNVYTGNFAYDIAGIFLITDTVTDSNGATATAEVQVSTLGAAYSAVTPTRILDTRHGTGVSAGKIGASSIVKLRVEGAGPIPSSGVTAVVMNVTVVATTGAGFITVYPSGDGTAVPNVSNLNYKAGKTVANLVTVPVGADGYVYLANSGPPAGPVDLIADVSGYYSRSAPELYKPASPERVLDTRNGTGAKAGAVANGGTVKLSVALGDTNLAPAGYMSAAAVNITVVNPSGNGYITAYADGQNRPGTSNLNYTKGQTVANSAIVPVAANGEIDLTNEMSAAGSANILVDIVGYYSTNANFAGAAFVPIAPSRVFDSRKDGSRQIQNGVEYDLALGYWAQSADAIEMNATVTGTKSNGFLSLYTYGVLSPPSTSNLNWSTGQITANAAYVSPDNANGWIAIYNGGSGATDVILDVSGYFEDSRVLTTSS